MRAAPVDAGNSGAAAPMLGAHGRARIGPNAITRTAESLLEELGAERQGRLFAIAGLERYLREPPEHMVDEAEVTRLQAVLHEQLDPQLARAICRSAGTRTGTYLLQRRIPRAVQLLLRALPAPAASAVLLAAIRRNSWTFAGTGEFGAHGLGPVYLSLHACPLCRGAHARTPRCDFYAACFERLFRVLVHPRSRVVETSCQAMGADACRFEVNWRTGRRATHKRDEAPLPQPPDMS